MKLISSFTAKNTMKLQCWLEKKRWFAALASTMGELLGKMHRKWFILIKDTKLRFQILALVTIATLGIIKVIVIL